MKYKGSRMDPKINQRAKGLTKDQWNIIKSKRVQDQTNWVYEWTSKQKNNVEVVCINTEINDSGWSTNIKTDRSSDWI